MVAAARRIVGFTGAGISTESGIPDFRSPNGVWARYRMIEYSEFMSSREGRIEHWRQKVEAWPAMRDAQPNAGHLAFVELERRGRLTALITQNIDGLHQRAGSRRVIELHGTATEAECQSCLARIPMDEALERVTGGEPAPECRICGGWLKPATVSFGQEMPTEPMNEAALACLECNLMIVAGSSLTVQPAASFPEVAKLRGAKLIIINRTSTPLDGLADAVLREEIGSTMQSLIGPAA